MPGRYFIGHCYRMVGGRNSQTRSRSAASTPRENRRERSVRRDIGNMQLRHSVRRRERSFCCRAVKIGASALPILPRPMMPTFSPVSVLPPRTRLIELVLADSGEDWAARCAASRRSGPRHHGKRRRLSFEEKDPKRRLFDSAQSETAQQLRRHTGNAHFRHRPAQDAFDTRLSENAARRFPRAGHVVLKSGSNSPAAAMVLSHDSDPTVAQGPDNDRAIGVNLAERKDVFAFTPKAGNCLARDRPFARACVARRTIAVSAPKSKSATLAAIERARVTSIKERTAWTYDESLSRELVRLLSYFPRFYAKVPGWSFLDTRKRGLLHYAVFFCTKFKSVCTQRSCFDYRIRLLVHLRIRH